LSPAAGKRAAILVVDDEPAVGVAMGRVLREHEVVIVTSVSEALRVLGTGKRFDVIFSDLMMPRTTGMDFYRELLGRSPRDAARIVFVTGGACTSEASKFLDSVSNERLEKPFAPKSVRALVQRFLK
jgi:CheY-like chemotaxis protein